MSEATWRGRITSAVGSVEGLAAIAVVLSPAVLSTTTLPTQPHDLSFLDSTAVLLGVAAFLVAAQFGATLAQHMRGVVITVIVAVVVMLTIRIGFVVNLRGLGHPPQDVLALLGGWYSEAGRATIEGMELIGESRMAVVRAIGYDRIPALYGWSYYLVLVLYTTSLLVAYTGAILGLVARSSEKSADPPPSPA